MASVGAIVCTTSPYSCPLVNISPVQQPSMEEHVPNVFNNKLKLDLFQAILNYQSVCFIISQLTNSISKLRHNYSLVKPFLEELVSTGLLIKINRGIKAGKNTTTLYIKVLPQSLMMHSIEQFQIQVLSKVQLSWTLYSSSCYNLVLSSSSAQLAEKSNEILTSPPYTNLVKQRLIARPTTLKTPTAAKTKKKEIIPIHPTNTLNTIHRYFASTKEIVVPPLVNVEILSTKNDDRSIVSSLPLQSQPTFPSSPSTMQPSTTSLSQCSSPSDELTSKYFRNPLLPRPYPRIARVSNRNSMPLQEVQQQKMDVNTDQIHTHHSKIILNPNKHICSEDETDNAQLHKKTKKIHLSDRSEESSVQSAKKTQQKKIN